MDHPDLKLQIILSLLLPGSRITDLCHVSAWQVGTDSQHLISEEEEKKEEEEEEEEQQQGGHWKP